MKIRPQGAELLHADRRTDMAKVTLAFRNFANAPEKTQVLWGVTPCRLVNSQ